MAQETSSHSLHTPIPFKLYVHHPLLSIENSIPNPLLNKRFFKHLHSIHLTSELELNYKTTRIKTLKTFDLTSRFSTKRIHIRRIEKFVKPRQKYLKNLKGHSKQPQIQKLLPLLTELNLGMSHEKWRPLAYSHKLHTLSLAITEASSSHTAKQNPLLQELRTNYTGTFPRTLAKLKNLKSLDIHLHGGNPERTLMILHLFRKLDFSRFRLEKFNFKITSAFDWSTQTPYVINQGVKKALPYVKELTLQDTKWFGSIFDGYSLENLSTLEVRIAPQNSIDFGSKLMTFKRLEKLKKLDFSFRAYSVLAEREFLESFMLPKNLETVHLTLINMKWNLIELTKRNRRRLQSDFEHDQRFVLFFNQWKELKSLKTLHIILNEELKEIKRCPGLAGNFASRIIRQVNSLENLSFTHHLTQFKPRKKKGRAPPALPVKSLDLREFWEALALSKNTLQLIKIETPEIAFPLKMSSLDNQFPCLKSLSLGKSVLWAKDLVSFWSGFKSLETVEMQGLRFNDEEKFESFIESLRENQKTLNSTLSINVEGIKYEFLMRCLNWLMGKKENQGKFELTLQNVQIKDQKEAEEDVDFFNWQANSKRLLLLYHQRDSTFKLTNEDWIDLR